MKFSSNNLDELNEFSTGEKQQILMLAQQQFTVPEKLSLNLIKLILLIPPFIFLARQEWLALLLVTTLSVAGFVLLMRPLSLHFCQKYLAAAIKKHQVLVKDD